VNRVEEDRWIPASCGLEFPVRARQIIEVVAGPDSTELKTAFVTSDGGFEAANFFLLFFFAFFLVAMFLFSLSIFHGCAVLSKKPQLMNV